MFMIRIGSRKSVKNGNTLLIDKTRIGLDTIRDEQAE